MLTSLQDVAQITHQPFLLALMWRKVNQSVRIPLRNWSTWVIEDGRIWELKEANDSLPLGRKNDVDINAVSACLKTSWYWLILLYGTQKRFTLIRFASNCPQTKSCSEDLQDGYAIKWRLFGREFRNSSKAKIVLGVCFFFFFLLTLLKILFFSHGYGALP